MNLARSRKSITKRPPLFKIVLVGDSKVGKTCWLSVCQTGEPCQPDKYCPSKVLVVFEIF